MILLFFPILILYVLLIVLYVWELYTVIRSTRQAKPPLLHPTRATVAAMLVLLSFLFPVAVYGVSTALLSVCNTNASKQAEKRWQRQEQQKKRLQEINDAVKEIQSDLGKKMFDDTGSRESREKINAYNDAIRQLDQYIRNENQAYFGYNSGGYSAGALGLPFAASLLCFAFPGTVMGFVYGVRIRKEPFRPGLPAALFAGLTWPLIAIISATVITIMLLQFTGFLIVLSVAGIFLGVWFALRYWLSV